MRGLGSKRERKRATEGMKSSISFRGGVYILPSAKGLNSCYKDIHIHAYTHTCTPLPYRSIKDYDV